MKKEFADIDYITDREYKIGLLQSLNGRVSLKTDDKELMLYLSNIYNKYVSNQIKDDDIDFKLIEAALKDERRIRELTKSIITKSSLKFH